MNILSKLTLGTLFSSQNIIKLKKQTHWDYSTKACFNLNWITVYLEFDKKTFEISFQNILRDRFVSKYSIKSTEWYPRDKHKPLYRINRVFGGGCSMCASIERIYNCDRKWTHISFCVGLFRLLKRNMELWCLKID